MRRLCAALLAATLAVLAGCTSSSHKNPTSTSSSAASADLANMLSGSIAGIKNAQVGVAASLLGQKISGSGPAEFSAGMLSALDISGSVPSVGDLTLLVVGGKVYAKLPASLNTSGKTWLAVTPTSKSAIIGQLASVLGQIESAASLSNLPVLARAASSVTHKSEVKGEHYTLVLDASKLPASFPGRSDLAGPALKNKPIDLWLDAQHRPTEILQTVLVSGSPVQVTIDLSRFNTSVSIVAPPASQVGTG